MRKYFVSTILGLGLVLGVTIGGSSDKRIHLNQDALALACCTTPLPGCFPECKEDE